LSELIEFGEVVHLWNEGYVGVIKLFEKIAITKKVLDKVNDIFANDMPVGFVKDPCETIRARGFVET
jgi:hypothetical protein